MGTTISNRVPRGGIGMVLLMAVSVLAAACGGTTGQPGDYRLQGRVHGVRVMAVSEWRPRQHP